MQQTPNKMLQNKRKQRKTQKTHLCWHVGRPSGRFRSLWGRSWQLYGRSWVVWGRSWPLLERSWDALGASWAPLGRYLATSNIKPSKKTLHSRPAWEPTLTKSRKKIDVKKTLVLRHVFFIDIFRFCIDLGPSKPEFLDQIWL